MAQMSYEEFKETANYKVFSPYMKLLTGFFFLDPKNNGFTFSELEKELKGEVDNAQLNSALDVGLDLMEITERDSERKGYFVRTYHLANLGRFGLDGFVRLLSRAKTSEQAST
ncbi:hypothetical protein JW756_05030 [Candidatus Woesearchaeota archaeon]|nr:hypothetical protein [Candidatus Woesearchaeota archaeon]